MDRLNIYENNNSGQCQSRFSRSTNFGNNQKPIGYFWCGNFNINSQCSGNNLYRLNKLISSPIVYCSEQLSFAQAKLPWLQTVMIGANIPAVVKER
jgi:hypothetical protein